MKTEFPGFFSTQIDDIDQMWGDCIFVLDANVLLNLYRYSDLTCAKLLDVFEALGERLWIPHQVAFEYLNNRLAVIGEQGKIYDDAVKKVEALKKSLESHNQHPFVSEATLTESSALFARLSSELNENKRVHDKRINSDEIKDKLGVLFDGKVGQAFERAQLERILKDGQERYEQKIPPGFCDVKKASDSIIFDERCRPYGDYIVWLQILDKAKADQKPVIFVTGDAKEDWWYTFQGKTLGPQPKLKEEFLSVVGSSFYMYSPDRFLERASEYLNQDDSEEAVKEIRDIRVDDQENMLYAIKSDCPSFPGKWFFDKTLGWVKDTDSSLREREEALVLSLLEMKKELQSLASIRAGLIALNIDSEEESYKRCVDAIRSMDSMREMVEVELERVRRERLTRSAADSIKMINEGFNKGMVP